MTVHPEYRKILYAHACYGQAEIDAVNDVLQNCELNLVDGPAVAEFERRVSRSYGKAWGVMVNSGSSANLLAIAALQLPLNSEVVTPALNWATTVAPIVQNGLVPAFVDVEPDSFTINASQIKAMIGERTKAMLVPDLVGNVADWPALAKIAQRYGLRTIQDSADTIGGTLAGRPTGSWSDLTTVSFYASHIITCAGLGGMVCGNVPEMAERVRLLRSWGRRSSVFGERENTEDRFSAEIDGIPYDSKFIFDAQGYNFLPSELGAAFGLCQFDRLEDFIDKRIANWQRLRAFFADHEDWFILPHQRPDTRLAWLAFPLVVRPEAPFGRHDLQLYFERRGIQTRTILAGNILRQPGFQALNCRLAPAGYPNTDRVMRGGLLVGCHQSLSADDIDYICTAFLEFQNTFQTAHSGRTGRKCAKHSGSS